MTYSADSVQSLSLSWVYFQGFYFHFLKYSSRCQAIAMHCVALRFCTEHAFKSFRTCFLIQFTNNLTSLHNHCIKILWLLSFRLSVKWIFILKNFHPPGGIQKLYGTARFLPCHRSLEAAQGEIKSKTARKKMIARAVRGIFQYLTRSKRRSPRHGRGCPTWWTTTKRGARTQVCGGRTG